MAYRVTQQSPQDRSTRKALGVQMPFNGITTFIPTYTSLEAYKVNLYNFFMTGKEERYLNPELGSNLTRYIFEPVSEQSTNRAIQETIQLEIEKFFPKLEVLNITVEDFSDYNSLQITIRFRIQGTELEDNLVLDIER